MGFAKIQFRLNRSPNRIVNLSLGRHVIYNGYMPRIKPTVNNPYALSKKQILTIEEVKNQLARGEVPNLPAAHNKVYDTNGNGNELANQNFNRLNYRQALIEALREKKIIGENGKVEQRLAEGLDAIDNKDSPNYSVRLDYIKEINKITGVYSPQETLNRRLGVSIQLSGDELEQEILKLEEELRS